MSWHEPKQEAVSAEPGSIEWKKIVDTQHVMYEGSNFILICNEVPSADMCESCNDGYGCPSSLSPSRRPRKESC